MKNAERFSKYLDGRSVLILGYGTEGRSSADLIMNNFPSSKITVYDRELTRLPEKIRFMTGEPDHIMDKFDIILKSPGIPLSKDFLARYSGIISSQTDLFLREFGDRTVGVTGTKGKSTTVSLIHSILDAAGKDTVLAGNIGVPAFDVLNDIEEDTVPVLELSSHQLQYIKKAPHISAILNVYPEHLDFYKNFIEYRSAKMNIVRMQTEEDHIIFPVKEFRGLERRSASEPYEVIIDRNEAFICSSGKTIVLDLNRIELKGTHNLYNIGAALIAAGLAGCGTEEAVKAVYEFKGLEHRMEYFGCHGGIDFYNDSICTIPQAAAAAIRALDNSIGSLILGGHFRGDGIVWHDLTAEIAKSAIDNIFFLPVTGRMMYSDLLASGFEESVRDDHTEISMGNRRTRCFFCGSLDEVIPLVFRYTAKGRNCLLSPASSSYNMFRNFEERGKVFKEKVTGYGGKNA